MGPTLSTITFSEMTDLIRKEFKATAGELVQSDARQLFILDPVGPHQGKTKRYDEFDTDTFARNKPELAAAKKARGAIGYNVTMTKKRTAIEIDISEEMRMENRYPEVGSAITNLTHYCPQRIELDLTHVITFADATSYTDMDGDTVSLLVGDGLALASAVHTLKYSSTTYSNVVAGAPVISRGAIEAAELLFTTNIMNNFGQRRVLKPNAIITGDDPNTVNTVKVFLASTTDVDQNNPGVINPYHNKYRHIILPWLASTATSAYDSTKRRRWALACIGLGLGKSWQAYYGEWEAPHMKNAPSAGSNNDDFSHDAWAFGARAGYGKVVVTGRGIVFSNVSS